MALLTIAALVAPLLLALEAIDPGAAATSGAAPTNAIPHDAIACDHSAAVQAHGATQRSRRDASGRARARSDAGTAVAAADVEGGAVSAAVTVAPPTVAAAATAPAAPDASAASATASDGTPSPDDPAGARTRVRNPDPPVWQVIVVRAVAAESGSLLRDVRVQVFAKDGVERTGETDYTGRVSFTVENGSNLDVEVKAPGRVRVRREGVTPPPPDAPLEFALERGVVVQGTVRGPDGAVLPGATVTAFATEPYFAAIPYDPDPRAIEVVTSKARGAYRLDCIPRLLGCTLVVEAPGCAPDFVWVGPQPDPDYVVRRDVALQPGVTLEGVVQDADREPIGGAWVYALAVERWPSRSQYTHLDKEGEAEVRLLLDLEEARRERQERFRARTGPDGDYRLVVPQRWVGHIRLLAMHGSAGRSRCLEPTDTEAQHLDLALRGRVRAEFLVTAPDGKPVLGAEIRPFFSWDRWTAPPRGKGLYGLADMEVGPVVLRAAGAVEAPGVYAGERVAVDQIRWLVRLQRGVTWSGSVRDDRQMPVAGATVVAGVRSGTTDEEGRFELTGVHPGTRSVTARAPAHLEAGTWAWPGRERGVQIVLPRASAVRVRLLLPPGAGKPTWRRTWTGTAEWGELRPDDVEWKDGVVACAEWNSRHTVLAVFVPRHEVIVLAVKAAPGEAIDLGEARLMPAAHLRGVVVDEAERPVAGAEVALRALGAPWTTILPERTVDTDARGEFEIERNAPGESGELLVVANGYAPTPQRVEGPAGLTQTVVLREPWTFRGLVVRKPEGGWRATVHGPSGEVYAQVPVRPDGTFEAEVPAPPHSVSIWATDEWRTRRVQRADVPAGLGRGEVFVLPE